MAKSYFAMSYYLYSAQFIFIDLVHTKGDKSHMKIVTWNLNNRANNHTAWEKIFELNADLLLLSEVNFTPEDLKGYQAHFEPAMGGKGKFRTFKTGLLCKGEIGKPFTLEAKEPWVTRAISDHPGNFVCRSVEISGESFNVISVHMPTWELPVQSYTADASSVALPNYSRIYMSELLWAALSCMTSQSDNRWIIGGDFNTSEFLGSKTQRAANVEAIARFERLGLIEVVRRHNGRPVPSYRPIRKSAKAVHQLDHLYVSERLLESPFTADVGDWAEFIDCGLSDHAPIIADLKS